MRGRVRVATITNVQEIDIEQICLAVGTIRSNEFELRAQTDLLRILPERNHANVSFSCFEQTTDPAYNFSRMYN